MLSSKGMRQAMDLTLATLAVVFSPVIVVPVTLAIFGVAVVALFFVLMLFCPGITADCTNCPSEDWCAVKVIAAIALAITGLSLLYLWAYRRQSR